MTDNTFQIVITPRDQQRVGAALAAYHHSDWRGVADVLREATDDHRGFQYHVAVLRCLALLIGLHGPDADQVLADLQQSLLTLAGLADQTDTDTQVTGSVAEEDDGDPT